MNARHPLSYITADPVVGATDFDDDREAEQDAYEAMLAEAEQQAPLIVLAALQALKTPGDWFRPTLGAIGMGSPDELLNEALSEDDATKSAFAEWAFGLQAQRVKQAMAQFAGRKRAMAIYLESSGQA